MICAKIKKKKKKKKKKEKKTAAGLTNSITLGKKLMDKAEPIYCWEAFSAPLIISYHIHNFIPTTRIIRDAENRGK